MVIENNDATQAGILPQPQPRKIWPISDAMLAVANFGSFKLMQVEGGELCLYALGTLGFSKEQWTEIFGIFQKCGLQDIDSKEIPDNTSGSVMGIFGDKNILNVLTVCARIIQALNGIEKRQPWIAPRELSEFCIWTATIDPADEELLPLVEKCLRSFGLTYALRFGNNGSDPIEMTIEAPRNFWETLQKYPHAAARDYIDTRRQRLEPTDLVATALHAPPARAFG